MRREDSGDDIDCGVMCNEGDSFDVELGDDDDRAGESGGVWYKKEIECI